MSSPDSSGVFSSMVLTARRSMLALKKQLTQRHNSIGSLDKFSKVHPILIRSLTQDEASKLRVAFEKCDPPPLLTPFHSAALLHRAMICSVPPPNMLDKIVARVIVTNGVSDSDISSMNLVMLLQIAELAKRWSLHAHRSHDECAEAFSNISLLSRHMQRSSPTMSDGEDAESTTNTSFSGSKEAMIPVEVLDKLLSNVGATFDFQSLFTGVDPKYDLSNVTLPQFRFCGGEEDPSVIEAFVALGGQSDMSGTIPVERIMDKCSAMDMTPQFIANFVNTLDANNDGLIDYSEFLAMVVRSRNEVESGPLDADKARSLKQLTGRGFSPAARRESQASSDIQIPRRSRFRRPSEEHGPTFVADLSTTMQPKEAAEDPIAAAMKDIYLDDEGAKSEDEGSSKSDSDLGLMGAESSIDVAASGPMTKRRSAIRAHHLGVNLVKLLGKQQGEQKTDSSARERIEDVVDRGQQRLEAHRAKVAHFLTNRSASHEGNRWINTEFGLMNGKGDNKLLIRQRRILREDAAAEQQPGHRRVPTRLVVVPQHTIDEMRKRNQAALVARYEAEKEEEQHHMMMALLAKKNKEKNDQKKAVSAMLIVAAASAQYTKAALTRDPSTVGLLADTMPPQRSTSRQRKRRLRRFRPATAPHPPSAERLRELSTPRKYQHRQKLATPTEEATNQEKHLVVVQPPVRPLSRRALARVLQLRLWMDDDNGVPAQQIVTREHEEAKAEPSPGVCMAAYELGDSEYEDEFEEEPPTTLKQDTDATKGNNVVVFEHDSD